MIPESGPDVSVAGRRRAAILFGLCLCVILGSSAPGAHVGQAGRGTPATATLVGVVLPLDARPGEVASGSVVLDPDTYKEIPALTVVPFEVTLPRDANGKATLQGMVVTVDGYAQHADEPLTFSPRAGMTRLAVAIGTGGRAAPLATAEAPLQSAPAAGTPTPAATTAPEPAYTTPPVCMSGGVQKIEGPLSGNSHETRIAVDGQPAPIVAQTPRAVYWRLPPATTPGPHQVTLAQHRTNVTFEVCALSLAMSADRLKLLRGESTPFRATLSGPERLPAAAWTGTGVPSDLLNVASLERTVPGFKPPKAGDPATILFKLQNASPETVSIRGSRNEMVVRTLGRKDFQAGPLTLDGVIQSRAGGSFRIDGLAVPFFRPIPGHVTKGPTWTGPGPSPCQLLQGATVHVEGTPGGTSGLWIVPVKVAGAGGSRLIRVFFPSDKRPALKFCDWIRITTCRGDELGDPYVDGYEPAEDPSKVPPAPPRPPEAPKPPAPVRPPDTVLPPCPEGAERAESAHEVTTFEYLDGDSQVTIQVYTDIDGALNAARNMAGLWKKGAVAIKTLGKLVPGGSIAGVLTKYLDEGAAILDAVAMSGLANRAREVSVQLDITTVKAKVESWTVEVCRAGAWVREKRCKVLPPERGAYKAGDTIKFVDQDRWGLIANSSKPQMFDPAKVNAWAKDFVRKQLDALAAGEAAYKEASKGCK